MVKQNNGGNLRSTSDSAVLGLFPWVKSEGNNNGLGVELRGVAEN